MSAKLPADDPHGTGPVLQAGTPLQQATGALVLLHGRGASAADILSLGGAFAPEGWAMLAPEGWAMLAPEAADRTWYPYSFLAPREQNEPWLSSALSRVDRVVQGLLDSGLPADRIVLAGFSQGACLTSEYAGTHPCRYGAVLAFTGGMIGSALRPEPLPGSFDGTPALFASGDPDPHVPWARVEETAERYRAAGAEVVLRPYPNRPHTVGREELLLAHELLARITPATRGTTNR
jgi:phospholipase/carboxylesterase